jgi:hypothetical protein
MPLATSPSPAPRHRRDTAILRLLTRDYGLQTSSGKAPAKSRTGPRLDLASGGISFRERELNTPTAFDVTEAHAGLPRTPSASVARQRSRSCAAIAPAGRTEYDATAAALCAGRRL